MKITIPPEGDLNQLRDAEQLARELRHRKPPAQSSCPWHARKFDERYLLTWTDRGPRT